VPDHTRRILSPLGGPDGGTGVAARDSIRRWSVHVQRCSTPLGRSGPASAANGHQGEGSAAGTGATATTRSSKVPGGTVVLGNGRRGMRRPTLVGTGIEVHRWLLRAPARPQGTASATRASPPKRRGHEGSHCKVCEPADGALSSRRAQPRSRTSDDRTSPTRGSTSLARRHVRPRGRRCETTVHAPSSLINRRVVGAGRR